MRNLKVVLLSSLLTCGHASAQAFKSPDILVNSKLDSNLSSAVITKFRSLLKTYKMADPFKASFDAPIMLNEGELGEYLPTESRVMIANFGEMVGLQILDGETKVWMHGFAYDVKGFKLNIQSTEASKDGLVINSQFSASEISLNAKKISLSLMIPGDLGSPVFSVDILRPVIRAKEDKLINFFTKMKIINNKSSYKLRVLEANFGELADSLVSSHDVLELDYEKIVIPKVEVQIGSKVIKFSPEKIQPLLRQNHQAIKRMLIAQVAKTLRDKTMTSVFEVLEKYSFAKDHWITSPDIKTKVSLINVTSSQTKIIEISLPVEFCTNEAFTQLKKECVKTSTKSIVPSRLTQKLHLESMKIQKELMKSGEVNILGSISEDFLNKVIAMTYEAGLWNAALAKAGIALGPNKALIRLDKKGATGALVMDVLYDSTRFERIMTGNKQVRFPLVMEFSIRIEKNNEGPQVIVHIKGVDTSDETLINGVPGANYISNVKDFRFKNKVSKAIRERISAINNTTFFEVPLPNLKGVGLHTIDFKSDGNGRMNAIMNADAVLND